MGDLDFIENKEEIVANNGDFELIPHDTRVEAMVTKASVEPNSKGTGMLLKTEYLICTVPWEGRTIKDSFNVQHPTQKAEQIGRGQAKALAIACGLKELPNDSSDLIDKGFALRIGVKKGEGINPQTGQVYRDSNEARGYYSLDKIDTSKQQTPVNLSNVSDDDMPEFLK